MRLYLSKCQIVGNLMTRLTYEARSLNKFRSDLPPRPYSVYAQGSSKNVQYFLFLYSLSIILKRLAKALIKLRVCAG